MSDLADDLAYLQAEAFNFTLEINPHAPCYDDVDAWHANAADEGAAYNPEDWLSGEQHEQALDSGRFVHGHVYPVGSVSFWTISGTDLAAVVAECARLCREERARWAAGSFDVPKPKGRPPNP